VDGDGIGDDKAKFLKEEDFTSRAGVGVTKILLMFRLGGLSAFVGDVGNAGGAFMGHGAVVNSGGKGAGSKHDGVEHGTPVAIGRDGHGD
jgi:hypothetical protein